MGNEQSHMPGLEIEKKAVEVTDFYTHYSASLNCDNKANVSVFIGEPLVDGSLWSSQAPLEKASRVRIYKTLYQKSYLQPVLCRI